ncbi:uncharacterized protein LOC126838960 [Adelges cooleyi]|uniref:uncharacterized protein LOC126838960 n=1 Tax=Adelges cooleyi TaxID=133065 RepID=UPI00218065CD|nr:uncharacterized protein LOC126838960 [Adelges cooleyi]
MKNMADVSFIKQLYTWKKLYTYSLLIFIEYILNAIVYHRSWSKVVPVTSWPQIVTVALEAANCPPSYNCGIISSNGRGIGTRFYGLDENDDIALVVDVIDCVTGFHIDNDVGRVLDC